MDSMITAAARALAAGDPLGALKRVALRDDAAALALRGTAMAQLGDFVRARALMRKAARAFGPREALARARCVVAEADIALASRDLAWPTQPLHAACNTLEAHGDHFNAAHARYLALRHLLLLGRLDETEAALAALDSTRLPPALLTIHELVVAGIAMRRVQAKLARAALVRATQAAGDARIPALSAEVDSALRMIDTPVARTISQGESRLLLLDDVEALLAVDTTMVVDACRLSVRQASTVISFATRPVLFKLARALGDAWPAGVPRDALITQAFRIRHFDETHRARLRVEIGRLRVELRALADVHATRHGFALKLRHADQLIVLSPPVEEEHAAVLALLADGEAWSSSALALALGISQRSVQRALDALADTAKVQWFGRGRARRWLTRPVPGFATSLLLPTPPAAD